MHYIADINSTTKGTTMTILSLNRVNACPRCGGEGRIEYGSVTSPKFEECPDCDGSGEAKASLPLRISTREK